ncbi:S-Ena type endospore appendage [Priestia filamentosa]|uniref:S-Ena type endospore appendage n=1 Tax=Priestia filamentosa TaxID=1402861 RepID=UPI0039825C26
MGKRAKKICRQKFKQKLHCVSHSSKQPRRQPQSRPRPTLNPPTCNFVNNRLCGNILLNSSVPTLEIWKGKMEKKATITLSVFNSSMSTSFIDVTITRNCKCPVEFTVPPGSTLSSTVDNAKSITVSQEDAGIADGKYNLEVCFATSS